MNPDNLRAVRLLTLAKELWPDVYFYKQQRLIIESVENNDETYVPAANEMGKDFVSGFIALGFFLTRHPCRIVTTSAKDDHLRVLWGEIGQFIAGCKYPLDYKRGGCLIINHQELRKIYGGQVCPKSYVKGMVASPDTIAAMQGHHIADIGDGVPRTLFISDESSSVPDEYYTKASTWFMRALVIGNTWPCSNFFRRGVKGGDIPRPNGDGFLRRVIRIPATESPNVRRAISQQNRGIEPDGKVIVPGVKSWNKYQRHLALWDDYQKTVCLNALFYEGKELRLFPNDLLGSAIERFRRNAAKRRRTPTALGIDPAEGGDDTAFAEADDAGVINLRAWKTPDTTEIIDEAVRLIRCYNIDPRRVCIDRGGGGKQIADQLRRKGYDVRTIAFGEPVVADPGYRTRPPETLMEEREERYVYKNRRAQLYGDLRIALENGFGLPDDEELHAELGAIPLWRDDGGRLFLPKKRLGPGERANPGKPTLVELIGHSPDRSDAVVLANHALTDEDGAVEIGVVA